MRLVYTGWLAMFIWYYSTGLCSCAAHVPVTILLVKSWLGKTAADFGEHWWATYSQTTLAKSNPNVLYHTENVEICHRRGCSSHSVCHYWCFTHAVLYTCCINSQHWVAVEFWPNARLRSPLTTVNDTKNLKFDRNCKNFRHETKVWSASGSLLRAINI